MAADLNGDNAPELAVTNFIDHNVGVLVNQGDGSFIAQSLHELDGDGEPRSIAAADLNGDGRRDLIAGASNKGTVNVLFNACVP